MQVNESGGDRSVKLTGGRNKGPAKKLIFKLIRNKNNHPSSGFWRNGISCKFIADPRPPTPYNFIRVKYDPTRRD